MAVDRAQWAANAPVGLNKYLWAQLQARLGWQKINNLVPITTPQDAAVWQESTSPYIVYNFRSVPVNKDDYYIRQDQMAFAIYSPKESDILAATRLMNYLFDQRDVSADALNHWMNVNAQGTNADPTVKRVNDTINYLSTWVVNSEAPQPTSEEGGRLDGSLVLQLRYTDDLFALPLYPKDEISLEDFS